MNKQINNMKIYYGAEVVTIFAEFHLKLLPNLGKCLTPLTSRDIIDLCLCQRLRELKTACTALIESTKCELHRGLDDPLTLIT